jgi:hypothetical protein
MTETDTPSPSRQKAHLNISPLAHRATIRVMVDPPSGAVLIYNAALGDEPLRFDGPFLVGHIPTDSPEIEVEMIEGAQECGIETISFQDDRSGAEHAKRREIREGGRQAFKPAISGERGRFYAAIGFAISQWQHVEVALANIFVSLTRSADGGAANAAFFSAISFSTKLDMVDAAARMRFFSHHLLPEWDTLYDVTHSKSKIRNNLAHFMSAIHVERQDKYRYYLQENVFDWNNFAKTKSPRYNFVNIENEARSFGEIAQKLITFLAVIPSLSSPAPAAPP